MDVRDTCIELAIPRATWAPPVQEPFSVAGHNQAPLDMFINMHLRFDTPSLACHATKQALLWWKGEAACNTETEPAAQPEDLSLVDGDLGDVDDNFLGMQELPV